ATISSGLYRFLAITVLLDVKDIPQVGLLQRGRISRAALTPCDPRPLLTVCVGAVFPLLVRTPQCESHHLPTSQSSCTQLPEAGTSKNPTGFPCGSEKASKFP